MNFKIKLKCIDWLLSIITTRVQHLPDYVKPKRHPWPLSDPMMRFK